MKKENVIELVATIVGIVAAVLMLLVNAFGMMELDILMKNLLLVWIVLASFLAGYTCHEGQNNETKEAKSEE